MRKNALGDGKGSFDKIFKALSSIKDMDIDWDNYYDDKHPFTIYLDDFAEGYDHCKYEISVQERIDDKEWYNIRRFKRYD